MLGSLEMEWPGSTRDRATPTFNRRDEAVYFLCHFPSGRPDRVLPGTLPCGVRTFLSPLSRQACTSRYGGQRSSGLLRTPGLYYWLSKRGGSSEVVGSEDPTPRTVISLL